MLNMIPFLISKTLAMGTPIAFTALGGCISERSGVNNLGLEGIMLASAFGAAVGSYFSGNAWVGILFGVGIGILISLIHGIVSITFGGKQAVSSMALVLIATGVSGVGLRGVFAQSGSSAQVANLPTSPIFAKIPVIGTWMSGLSPFVYLVFLTLAIIVLVITFTPFGLHITMVGENPKAAEAAGIPVHLVRYICVMISGALGGMGGAFLSIGNMNLFQTGMVAGRGYLALGAVTMGKWNPKWVFASAMFFGMFDAIQLYIQTVPGNPIPSQFVQMIPYVMSLALLCITMKRGDSNIIAAGGEPYTKFI